MAKQIVKVLSKKSKRAAVLAVRNEFRGKDQVNIREFLAEGTDEYNATKAGFTIPAEAFPEFFKAMRKFGRAAGLLGKAGDDDFEIKSLDDLDDDDSIKIVNAKTSDDKEEKAKGKKTGIIRKAKDDEPKGKRGRKAKDEDDEDDAPKNKRGRKAKEDDDADDGDAFDLKGFKKAIKLAVKHDDDLSYAANVVSMYKDSRKKLKDLLPKHAVNALEKSLANKKDESFLAKAVGACEKHIVEKDFSL